MNAKIEVWTPGTAHSIVSDTPQPDGVRGSDDTEYYGGHLIAESVSDRNRKRICAVPEMERALMTALTFAERELEMRWSGMDAEMVAEAAHCVGTLKSALRSAGHNIKD